MEPLLPRSLLAGLVAFSATSVPVSVLTETGWIRSCLQVPLRARLLPVSCQFCIYNVVEPAGLLLSGGRS